MTDSSDVTRLLQEFGMRAGAEDELLPLVYENLRSIARARFRDERREHTLQATALVHEAYARLIGGQTVDWEHRAHFYRVAAEAMRRVLIDHARAKRTEKRGSGVAWVPLADIDLAGEYDLDDVLVLDDALSVLESEDERAAQVVKLRFYAGLTVDEVAAALQLSARTVAREWEFARARLFDLLGDDADRTD